MPPIVNSLPVCVISVSHSRSGRLLLISSRTCTGAALAAAQLLDERDALLQLRLARLELLHLREHRPELLRLGSRRAAMSSSSCADCCRSDQNHQPMPSDGAR